MVAGGSVLQSLMLVAICLECVVTGTPVILDLHRFIIAISRVVVSQDGREGTASDPFGLVCWCLSQEASAGSLRFGIGHFFLGHLIFGILNPFMCLHPLSVLKMWFVGRFRLLVKWVSFLGTLHWPAGSADLGVGGPLLC